MKFLFIKGVLAVLTGCSTVGGAMQGAGQDLNQVGQYIKTIGK
jgi:predicted small secreted protein